MTFIYKIIFAALFLSTSAWADPAPLLVLKDQAFRKKIALNTPASFNIENLVTHGRVSVYETKSSQIQLSGEIHGDMPGVLITVREFEDQIFISVSEMAHLTSVVGSAYALDTSASMHLKIGVPKNLLKNLHVVANSNIHLRGSFKNSAAPDRQVQLKSYYGSIDRSSIIGQLIEVEQSGSHLQFENLFELASAGSIRCSAVHSLDQ